MRRLGWIPLAVIAVAAQADVPGPAPRLDAWRVLGPGGGGTMRRPAVSPHDPRVVVEGCDMTGAYITRDAGQSWRMFHLGWVPEAFAFDPKDERVIYAGTGALWRSEDAGQTWAMVFPDPARNTVEHGWGDHADVVYTTDDPLYPSGLDVNIQSIAVDPVDTRRIVIASSATPPGPPGSQPTGHSMILGSEDRGRTWARIAELAPSACSRSAPTDSCACSRRRPRTRATRPGGSGSTVLAAGRCSPEASDERRAR